MEKATRKRNLRILMPIKKRDLLVSYIRVYKIIYFLNKQKKHESFIHTIPIVNFTGPT